QTQSLFFNLQPLICNVKFNLHFDVDDFANDQGPKDLGNEGANAHLDAELVRPQKRHVIGFQVEHEQEQGERQGDEDHAAEPAFPRQGLDLAQDAVALSDYIADLVQNLRQVAAGLPLDQHRGDKKAQVQIGDALTHAFHGVLDGDAQVLLLVNPAELG